MKGAGFCLLFQGFYYIEVYYIESRVYLQKKVNNNYLHLPFLLCLVVAIEVFSFFIDSMIEGIIFLRLFKTFVL